MDFSYENERLVLTINCLQELDYIATVCLQIL